eukprot:11213600-Lingulodinium_polyedra.AAC.1
MESCVVKDPLPGEDVATTGAEEEGPLPDIPPEVEPAGPDVRPLEHPPLGTSAPLVGDIGFDAVGADGRIRPICSDRIEPD